MDIDNKFRHRIMEHNTALESASQTVVNGHFHVGAVVIRSVVATECVPHAVNRCSASEERIFPPSRSFHIIRARCCDEVTMYVL